MKSLKSKVKKWLVSLTPVELKIEGHNWFYLTKAFQQWNLNVINWIDSKNSQFGYIEAEILPVVTSAAIGNPTKYNFGYLSKAGKNCESDANKNLKLKVFLIGKERDQEKVSREFAEGQDLAIDQSKNIYSLRVEIDNSARCAQVQLELGITARI